MGQPYGRVWSSKLGSTVLIRRRQLDVSRSEEGWELAKEWVQEKLQNQVDFLQELGRRRSGEKEALIDKEVGRMANIQKNMDDLEGTPDELRGTVMGLEGSAGRIYFQTLGKLLPDRYGFGGRSRNPAGDRFNAFLNYGYGVLYSKVEASCVIAGLDPYIGFIHADNYNKVSLVFDLIEMFRIFVEEPVFYLFSKRQVSNEHVDEVKGGVRLNEAGRALLIETFNDHMEEGPFGFHHHNL
jgi:CRISPR-associated protein Cas1